MFRTPPPCSTTSSFDELDGHTKATLHRLYVSYFFERQEELWAEGAMRKLPALKAASGTRGVRVCAARVRGVRVRCVRGPGGCCPRVPRRSHDL